MYQTTHIVVKSDWKDLMDYCHTSCELAKLMRNAVIFRCRQIISADGKDFNKLHELELQVLNEFDMVEQKRSGKKLYVPSYESFDRMFKNTVNPDYHNSLPKQTNQQIIKSVKSDFKGFFRAIADYRHNPSKYTGEPKLPKYVKTSQSGFDITNQDAVIKVDSNGKKYLKLPKTKAIVPLGNLKTGRLKEVSIIPFYDTYKISLVMECDVTAAPLTNDSSRVLGIDLGVNNFASVNNNCGLTPFIINGKALKSYNQWYNKELAKLKSFVMKDDKNQYTSKRIQKLHKDHYHKTNDFYNKAASYIINYCKKNQIGTIIVGKNDSWKQDINLGKQNNQTFCFIAHAKFISKLTLMAERMNINVIVTEESYTSKASLIDMDDMNSTEFHGKRVKRGLYQTKNGILMNADINGAGNIIRKVIKDAYTGIDLSYMYKTVSTVNV